MVLLPLAVCAGPAGSYSHEVWALLAYLGLVPTALGYLFFFRGIHFIRASTAAILTLIEPLVAIVSGVDFLCRTPRPGCDHRCGFCC